MRRSRAVALDYHHATLVLAGRLIGGIDGAGGFSFVKTAVRVIRFHGIAVFRADAEYFRFHGLSSTTNG